MKTKPKPKPKLSKSTAAILLVAFCVVAVFSVKIFLGQKSLTSKKAVSSRSKGDPKAPIQIVEYLDFQCPACAKGAKMLSDYFKKYPAQVFIEVRFYPIPRIHEHALQSAIYAECAARQDKFWPFQDLLIEKQSQWSRMINAENLFKEMAASVNLDMAKLNACVNDEKIKEIIFKEKAQGKAQGVDSTPTYFINGKMVVGPVPLTNELGEKTH